MTPSITFHLKLIVSSMSTRADNLGKSSNRFVFNFDFFQVSSGEPLRLRIHWDSALRNNKTSAQHFSVCAQHPMIPRKL